MKLVLLIYGDVTWIVNEYNKKSFLKWLWD